jgi:Spy/CpxP family protein refolding chaperone
VGVFRRPPLEEATRSLAPSSEVFSEGTLAMIARRLTLVVVLAIVASMVWIGCQPAVQPSAGSQKGPPPVQTKASPKPVRIKADENLIPVKLLMADAVQKDLDLSADQMGKIRDFIEVSRQRSREFVANFPDFLPSSGAVSVETSEVREAECRAWLRDWQTTQRELRAKVVGMLTPSQRKRLQQVQLQQAIAAALARPEIIEALSISEEQLARIRPLCDFTEKRFAELQGLGGQNRKDLRKRSIELSKELEKAQAEANQLALDVLTPEQRAKLEKFVGKKIEVTWDYEALVPEDAPF